MPMTDLQFCKRKSTAGSNAAVVFDCGTSYNGTKFVDWARRNSGGFRETSVAATLLSSRLWSSASVGRLESPS